MNIDGRYVIFADGSDWEYVRIVNGVVVSELQYADLDSEVAGHGPRAWLSEIEFDTLEEIHDDKTHEAILAACGWGDHDPEQYIICPVEKASTP